MTAYLVRRDSLNPHRVLGDFAAMAVRHQRQQHALMEQAKAAPGRCDGQQLAHQINNPLQSLMNIAYLAAKGHRNDGTKAFAQETSTDLQRLSALVQETLERSC